MTGTGGKSAAECGRRSRIVFLAVAATLTTIALIIDPLARQALSDGTSIHLGPLDLRLAYNSGVAFSMGDHLPTAVLLVATGLITVGIGLYGWRAVPTSHLTMVIGLGAILAGATANVIDRVLDAKVTDYFHTGWWPTFNIADTYITFGAVIVIVGMFSEAPLREPAPIGETSP